MALAQLHSRGLTSHCRAAPAGSNARLATIAHVQSTRAEPQQEQLHHSGSAITPPHRSPAAAAVAVVAAAAAAAPTYQVLSVASLPPLRDVASLLSCAAAGAAAALALTKAVMGDRFHVQLHKGRLYLQFGVPSRGPPAAPGSIVTRPTGDARGNGAFAASPIADGTHIADYSGERLDRAAFYARYPDGVGNYAMSVDDDWVIDAAGVVADTSSFHPVHMNHSRSRHNVARYYHRPSGRVAFFATRDIQPGEELLYNYGRNYWRGREHLELP